MIEHLAYLAALNAPAIASAASDTAGSLIEKTGRRLASGLCDELESRMKASSASVLGSLVDAVASGVSGISDTIKALAESELSKALDGEGVTVADKVELGLLRELATQVATGTDTTETLAKLKAFLAKKAQG